MNTRKLKAFYRQNKLDLREWVEVIIGGIAFVALSITIIILSSLI